MHFLAPLLLLVLVLAACGGDDPAPGSGVGRSAVAVARADPVVAAALREGRVERVVQRPAPGGGTAVAFLFAEPVEPRDSPFTVLCDVAGQTPQWRGVAAVVTGEAVQDASPVWLGGANCAGLDLN